MLITRFVVSIFSVGLMVLGAAGVSGQDYPNKPIRVLASAPGGSTDFLARIIAQGLPGTLGQPVIVDNRAGGTLITGEIVARAPPDGYTLLISSDAWLAPLIRKMPYSVRDFSPISLLTSATLLLVVHPAVPVKSVKELIDSAKAKPGALNYSSGPAGGPAHLSAELFKSMAGVNIVRVPYKSGGASTLGLLGGEVQMTIDVGTSMIPHIKSGKLRGLAITSPKPSALFPDLPTVAATLPRFEAQLLTAVFAPAGTPATIISRLNRELVRLHNQADVKEKYLSVGLEIIGSSPEQLAATMKAEIALWGKVIKDAGIKAD